MANIKTNIYENAVIHSFDDRTEPGKLKVFFRVPGSDFTKHAYAHPALGFRLPDEQYSPVAKLANDKVVCKLEVVPTEEGWKFYECLRPSEARKTAYEEALKNGTAYRKVSREVSEEDIAKNIDF